MNVWAATASDAVSMRSAKKLALAGIFSALCVVFLFVGSLFQTLDLSAAAIASIIVLIAYIELGKGWSLGVYAVASLLSLLLLPQKTAAAVFAFFVGFYPILKVLLNNVKPKWLSYIARIVCFNFFLTVLIYVSTKLLGIEEDFLGFGYIIYGLANITFLVFDFALERISVTYVIRIKPKLFGRR